MKKTLLSIILSLACGFVAMAQQKMPDVKVELSDGSCAFASSLCGQKPLIVSYWSIACKPCIQELNAISDALEDWLKEADFEVVAVSTDDARLQSQAKARAKSSGWTFTCVYDTNQDLMRAMNVSLTPHSFVVDKNGNIVYSHSGYTPGSEEVLFEKVLELSRNEKKKK